jgi:hypothetical protein
MKFSDPVLLIILRILFVSLNRLNVAIIFTVKNHNIGILGVYDFVACDIFLLTLSSFILFLYFSALGTEFKTFLMLASTLQRIIPPAPFILFFN